MLFTHTYAIAFNVRFLTRLGVYPLTLASIPYRSLRLRVSAVPAFRAPYAAAPNGPSIISTIRKRAANSSVEMRMCDSLKTDAALTVNAEHCSKTIRYALTQFDDASFYNITRPLLESEGIAGARRSN
jgi:hypothetical protein